MSTGATIGIVIAVLVVLAVIAVLLMMYLQRQRLRRKFGPEYERAVQNSDNNRLAAERELAKREKEHSKLDLKPLSPVARDNYSRDWTRIQEQFVDAPTTAVGRADRLVTSLMAERGYPTEGYEQKLNVLSVDHARTLEHYRAAHEVSRRQERGEASTEDLRNAMVHYRTLFEDLLDNSRADGEDVDGRRDVHRRA